MAEKKFEDLNLKDAFLFGAAMTDPETCKLSMEIILGKKISGIKVHAEHSMFYSSDYHSVRLDVYATDEAGENYDVEMQGENKDNLPRRSRFYQAQMDVSALKPGEGYEKLKPSYVIFICDFDPFGKGAYRYTFEHYCREWNFPLEDGATRIFLNAKGQNVEEVPPELVHFLQYVCDSTEECVKRTEDVTIRRLHNKVSELKKSREWRAQYMKFEELLQDREKETENRFATLITKMTEAGETDKLPQLSDATFRAEMLKKYHL